MEQARVQVVVAVKDLPDAKSRLAPILDEPQRSALVLAMLADTVAAALRSPAVAAVHVVTGDPMVSDVARAAGASVVDDPTNTLNEAFAHAAAGLDASAPVLALPGDLPALHPAELTAAVVAAGGRRAAVADATGTGTTMLLAPAGASLDPRFGPRSAAAHSTSGAVLLPGGWPGLRGDVDTVTDLGAAVRAGLGAATADLLDRGGRPATVAGHADGVVELRTDDGALLRCSATAAELGGWRQLRAGQRVRVHADGAGTVYLLTGATTPPG